MKPFGLCNTNSINQSGFSTHALFCFLFIHLLLSDKMGEKGKV